MKHYFADSSFLIAWFSREDAFHKAAHSFMEEAAGAAGGGIRFTLTDYVFDEVVTFLRFQTGRHDVAAKAGQTLRRSRATRLMPVGVEAFNRAWELFVKRKDKAWSFTDCTSFVVMEDLGLRTVLSFDSDFGQAGFEVSP